MAYAMHDGAIGHMNGTLFINLYYGISFFHPINFDKVNTETILNKVFCCIIHSNQ